MDLFSDLSTVSLVLFFIAGLCAGFVDSIAGGGGLISLPVLLFAGLPPQVALGTNKLQSSFGSFSAAFNYVSKGTIELKGSLLGICFTFIGAVSGAFVIQQMDAAFLKHLVPILLLLVFFYTLLSPDLGRTDRAPKIPSAPFFILFGMLLGFYDGFFGPGTGSFWTASLLVVLGLNMTRAVGMTKIMNFTSNFVALIVFIIGGNVAYAIGIVMAVGQLIGARIGSNMAIERGTAFIRPLFLTVVFLTIVRLVYQNFTG
ncbi:MAG: hypothetical protein D3926_07305 [Desulfobacteraceae bacterium]|nr:MAG: hypothetical protein D3926_07305 [Desulfobacteraceae bacterium]